MMSLYCDDTKNFKAIYNDKDYIGLQKSIDNLVTWSERNRMRLNPAKTYHVSYTRSKSQRIIRQYYIGSTRIETKNEIKDLGVLFDSRYYCYVQIY